MTKWQKFHLQEQCSASEYFKPRNNRRQVMTVFSQHLPRHIGQTMGDETLNSQVHGLLPRTSERRFPSSWNHFQQPHHVPSL